MGLRRGSEALHFARGRGFALFGRTLRRGRGQRVRCKMAAASVAGQAMNVFPFRDARAAPDPVLEAGPVAHGPQPVPLVLDNGSFQARAGWACPGPDPGPEPRLQFRSVCARGRGGARGGAGPQVGNALGSLEPLRWMLRSPFDRNVPVNLELQELLLDYSFQHLGVSSQVKGGVGMGLREGLRSCPRSLCSPRDNSHSRSSDCHLVIHLLWRSNIKRLMCIRLVLSAWGIAVNHWSIRSLGAYVRASVLCC